MSRPLRLEFPDALYHVTARGDRREDIFEDDEDRRAFLSTLAQVVGQFNWLCYAWCLMGNHYHLLVQTPEGNLSKGMRQLNGVYSQAYNRRHGLVGHLFQGRFKAILVDSDAYLLELARYVVLNPVRAGMVRRAQDWSWSSYRASMGLASAPEFLAVDGLLAQFATHRSTAQARYAQFVQEGVGAASPWNKLKSQVYLGDDAFVSKMLKRAQRNQVEEVQIPKAQRRAPAPSLKAIDQSAPNRNAAMARAVPSKLTKHDSCPPKPHFLSANPMPAADSAHQFPLVTDCAADFPVVHPPVFTVHPSFVSASTAYRGQSICCRAGAMRRHARPQRRR